MAFVLFNTLGVDRYEEYPFLITLNFIIDRCFHRFNSSVILINYIIFKFVNMISSIYNKIHIIVYKFPNLVI